MVNEACRQVALPGHLEGNGSINNLLSPQQSRSLRCQHQQSLISTASYPVHGLNTAAYGVTLIRLCVYVHAISSLPDDFSGIFLNNVHILRSVSLIVRSPDEQFCCSIIILENKFMNDFYRLGIAVLKISPCLSTYLVILATEKYGHGIIIFSFFAEFYFADCC
ncbi:hypothetical protein NPIL_488361 [Nephila pilipes]|uniref:Uncharacterized protein n=1 Tax=Nephila pilipes TaxID=299642 RepID=A0A8X6P3U2_NEPPI|nr:hypothetical protein NPIL_488361 [Nephila pilipes]